MTRLAALLSLLLLLTPAAVAQTYSYYEYDALGRLVRTEDQTSLATTLSSRVRYIYDLRDNRVRVKQGADGPTANPDSVTLGTVYLNGEFLAYSDEVHVLDNDTDPDLPADLRFVQTTWGNSTCTVASPFDIRFIGTGPENWLEFDPSNVLPDGPYTFWYKMVDGDGQPSCGMVSVTKVTMYCDDSGCH